MDQAKYAELFRTEAREHLAELDATLLTFEQDGDSARVPEYVASLFRNTHTIKGMAAAMGYRGAERMAHALETLLDGARRGPLHARDALLELLFDGTDALRLCVDDVVAGKCSPAQDTGPPTQPQREHTKVGQSPPRRHPQGWGKCPTPAKVADVRIAVRRPPRHPRPGPRPGRRPCARAFRVARR